MPHKKKIKKMDVKNNNGLAKIATLTTNSISSAFSNYKKNKELEIIREIKLHKLREKNQIQKERKELRNWEERLNKESNKIRLSDEELKIKEKEIKSREEIQKIDSERLIKKDEHLILIAKELRLKEKELKLKEEGQNRKNIARIKTYIRQYELGLKK